MIKLYITAVETKENGQAVTLFEDLQVNYEDKLEISAYEEHLSAKVLKKLEEVELSNEQATNPF